MTHWLGLRCSPSVALGPCGCGASDTEHSEQVPASAAAVELLHENTYFEVSLAPSGPKAAVERATAAVHVPFRDSSGAQLTASNGKPLRGTCGVTFISPKHAVTAAHCVEDPDVKDPKRRNPSANSVIPAVFAAGRPCDGCVRRHDPWQDPPRTEPVVRVGPPNRRRSFWASSGARGCRRGRLRCRNAGEPCDNATCVASCEAGFVGLCAHEEKARYSCYMTQGLLECHEGILDHDQQPDVCEAENAAVTSCLCESEVVQCP